MSSGPQSRDAVSSNGTGSVDHNRRTVLQMGALGAVSLAGCLRGDGDVTPTPGEVDEEVGPTPASGPTPDQTCAPRTTNADNQRVRPLNECQREHPRHPGQVTAMGWTDEGFRTDNGTQPPNSVEDFESIGFASLQSFYDNGRTHSFKEEKLEQAVAWLKRWPDGRRALSLRRMPAMFSNIYGNRDLRDAPIVAVLAEDIDGEMRGSIQVEPIPTDLFEDENHTVLTYNSSEVPLKREYVNTFTATRASKGATELSLGGAMISGSAGDPILLTGGQSFWPYHSVRTLQQWTDRIMTAISDADLTLNYIIMDNQTKFIAGKDWSRTANFGDPRWTDPVHGFEGRSLSELARAQDWDGAREEQGPFEALVRFSYEWAVHAGIVAPAREHFPELRASDWTNIGLTVDSQRFFPGLQTPSQAGTHSSWLFFDWGDGPNEQLRATVNYLRSLRKFTNGAIQPWIGSKGAFDGSGHFEAGVRNNYMYDEMVRHIALHEPDPILYSLTQYTDSWAPEQDLALDAVLTEVNATLDGGYSLLTEFVPWRGERWQRPGGGPGWGYNTMADKLDDGDVTTGVKLEDGTVLWRLSCRRFGLQPDNSLPDDSGPVEITVTEGGSEVDTTTIPGGEGGVWWRHDDPDDDLAFEYAYPELKQ